VTWNTATVANGAATLTATAFDAYGNSTASAPVAVTVDNVPDTTPPNVSISAPVAGDVSGTVTVSANATDDMGVAQVQFFADSSSIGIDTSAPYSVQWNTSGLAGIRMLTAEASDGAGNKATSAAVQVNVTTAAPTLAQLQTNIFTPRCVGCHNGSGGVLPGSMNLSSATTSFSALVNVTSEEVGTIKRVLPGNPDNSYLVKKLEGTQTVGDRMPFGGPYLDQATINQVRDWIQAGALP
jgi:mono/diheme cytochrome c family protein